MFRENAVLKGEVTKIATKLLAVSGAEFKQAMGRFASGVTVVTIPHQGENARVHGITVSAFVSGSLEPPLVLVSIAKKARSHPLLLAASHFGVSILAKGQEAISNHFAGYAAEVQPEFATLEGVTVVAGALAQLCCRLEAKHDTGDHTLFVGMVEAVRVTDAAPLLYFHGQYGEFAVAADNV